jgi:hypothetical protein
MEYRAVPRKGLRGREGASPSRPSESCQNYPKSACGYGEMPSGGLAPKTCEGLIVLGGRFKVRTNEPNAIGILRGRWNCDTRIRQVGVCKQDLGQAEAPAGGAVAPLGGKAGVGRTVANIRGEVQVYM